MLSSIPAWHLFKNRVEYGDLGADHFSRRNHDQQIRRLVRRLNELGCTVQITLKPA